MNDTISLSDTTDLLDIDYLGYTLEELGEMDIKELAEVAIKSSYARLGLGDGRISIRLTPPLMIYIFKLMEAGLTITDAAHLANVSTSSIFKWRKRGADIEFALTAGQITEDILTVKERYEYFFYLGMYNATAAKKLRLLGMIEEAATKSWQAAAWILERSHPDEFGQRMRIEQVDWRSEVIGLIKNGLPFGVVVNDLGEERSIELFESAGIEIDAGRLGPGDSEEGEESSASDSQSNVRQISKHISE